MRELLASPDVVVFDDVLEVDAFEQVWRFVQLDTYRLAHSEGWSRSWGLDDGDVYLGSLHHSAIAEGAGAPPEGHVSPLGIAMDLVVSAVAAAAERVSDLIGTKGVDWEVFNARSYLYPAGTGLKWHQDGQYAGAFTYYTHPTWNARWGGELLVAEPSTRGWGPEPVEVMGFGPRTIPPNLDNSAQSEMLMAGGHGLYVACRPNRLVFIGPGVYHTILPVRASATGRARCSIAGFFQRKPATTPPSERG